MRLRRILLSALALAALCPALPAQESRDSLVTLISAKSASLIEQDGQSFRKVVGPARFLHNDTYLLCDTALWNVSTNVIFAEGHVQIIQDRTRLTSSTLEYVVDEDLAKFRGNVVQLEDKDKNTLRTRYLDYNTKDSVAIFENGASMRDKDGQIIESRFGSYDSKAKTFQFMDEVNMFTDSIFIKTSRLEYRSDLHTAYFGYGTDAWEHENMLSADDGWYDRDRELFFFSRNVHLMTRDSEAWSDTLYYQREIRDVELLGNAEVMDTTRNVYALAGRLQYSDTLSQLRMTRDPAILSIEETDGQRDTLYFGADTLLHRSIPMCDIHPAWLKDAEKRLSDLNVDPVTEYRRKAAEEARKREEEARKNDPNRPPERPGAAAEEEEEAPEVEAPPEEKPAEPERKRNLLPREPEPSPDSEPAPPDSLAKDALPDSLKAAVDSLALAEPVDTVQKDTTKVGFLWAVNNVRLYRDDIQMACDSLTYTDLDSLIRMYRAPFVFNERGTRQYTADSIYVIVKDQTVKKANLMSNAFIATQEDSVCFDQIKGAEVVAYFNDAQTLDRFDALGGASAMFFLEENDALATVNKVESKMLYAQFSEGNLDRVYYFESAKNDAYPIVQLPKDSRYMKGFDWQPEKRPRSGRDITPLRPRRSERLRYEARPRAQFQYTESYFPGHMDKIRREIAVKDSLDAARARQRRLQERERELAEAAGADSLARADTLLTPPAVDSLGIAPPPADSLHLTPKDSLDVRLQMPDSLPAPDSLQVLDSLKAPKDSLAAHRDTVRQAAPVEDPKVAEARRKAEEKALKEAEKARKAAEKAAVAAEKQAAREAKWAEEDRIYAEKQAAKKQKALDKQRARKLKELRRRAAKADRERERLARYIERYEKKKARKEERKNRQ